MKKSTISAIAAVSAAGVVALSLGAVTDWYKNWDGSTWFNYWGKGAPTVEEPVTPDTPDDPNTPDDPSKPSEPVTPVDSDKGGAIVTDGDNNGIQIKTAKLPRAAYAANGVSEQAESAYVLTASIQPSDATNKNVTFTAAWSNPNSAWASGKNLSDYVTVTQSSAGSRSATIECKQAFGERVIVTCTSEDNAEASATCLVDYEKRALSVGTAKVVDSSTGDVYLTLNPDGTTSGGVPITSKAPYVTCNIVYEATYSAYTVNKDIDGELRITISNNAWDGYFGSTHCNMNNSACQQHTCTHKVYGSQSTFVSDSATFDLNLLRSMISFSQESNQLSETELRYGVSSLVTFDVSLFFGGEYVRNYTSVPYNSSLLVVAVESVGLDNSNIIF